MAAAQGRRLRPCTSANIICKATDAEAEDYLDWMLDNADENAISAWHQQSRQAVHAGLSQQSMYADERALSRDRIFIGGATLVGSPRRVAEQLMDLHRQGIEGVHMIFLDFDELNVVGPRLLELLQEAGLR